MKTLRVTNAVTHLKIAVLILDIMRNGFVAYDPFLTFCFSCNSKSSIWCRERPNPR